MKQIIVTSLILISAFSAHAKKSCTDQPKDKWMKVEEFKKKAQEMGYTINKFKTPGSCYEIYGKNKEGKKVETYFNPVDGSVFKESFE
jgi:hypothetical protein